MARLEQALELGPAPPRLDRKRSNRRRQKCHHAPGTGSGWASEGAPQPSDDAGAYGLGAACGPRMASGVQLAGSADHGRLRRSRNGRVCTGTKSGVWPWALKFAGNPPTGEWPLPGGPDRRPCRSQSTAGTVTCLRVANEVVKSPSGILLITPESLEALFVIHGHHIRSLRVSRMGGD